MNDECGIGGLILHSAFIIQPMSLPKKPQISPMTPILPEKKFVQFVQFVAFFGEVNLSMKTLVIGLGNPILTDDGVGVKVAYELERILADSQPDVTVTEASAGGLRLMEMMIGYDRAIIVDAYTNGSDNTPGQMHRMTLEDLRTISPTQHSASAHDTTLATALDSGKAMGLHLPDEIVIFAIEVENVIDFSDEPTTAVAAAIPGAVTAVLSELNRP